MQIIILYEDIHIIIVEKPQGISVQKDRSNNQDLLTSTEFFLKLNNRLNSKDCLYLINRIDRPVGGIVLMAKNLKSARYYSNQLQNKLIEKHYLCVCSKFPTTDSKTITNYISVDKTNNKSLITSSNDGKKSTLSYKKLQISENLSLLKINLITGRHHQIRAQLSNFNLPIWGDTKYNLDFQDETNVKIALWAYHIKLNIFKTSKIINIYSYPNFDEVPWKKFKKV